jgi:hypothetical protein
LTGFLDEDEGVYRIHDFWHHAPDYVRKRRAREDERRTKVDPCPPVVQSPTGQGPAIDRKTARLPHPHPHPHPQEGTPSGSAVLGQFIEIWNSRLVPLGYSRCDKATAKRDRDLKTRLKADPDFLAIFTKAVDYLAGDAWWKERASKFTIDLLLGQVSRAQELSEKKPTPTGGTHNGNRSPQHRAAVDAAYVESLGSRPAPAEPVGDDAALLSLFGTAPGGPVRAES